MDFIKRRDKDRDRDRDRERDLPRRRDDDRPLKKHRHDDDERPRKSNGDGSTSSKRRMSGAAAVQRATTHLVELTRRRPEAVSALNRTGDGWRVVLEIVELERIPHTTDILASYAVELDNDGELMGYQRVARYYRSDVTE